MAVVCALHPIPMQGALHHGNLFSVALGRHPPSMPDTSAFVASPAMGFHRDSETRTLASALASAKDWRPTYDGEFPFTHSKQT
ncbi:hypothetical protein THIX_20067 [Thiomonas sp. X19]|nr:hypothetical protein THIX_20067 [Thiomonas sp. X19]